MGCLRRLLTKCCRRGRHAWAWAEGRRLRTPRQEVPWADRGESIRRRRGADDHAHSQAPASRVQAPRGPSRPRSLVISHLVSKVTLDTVVTQVGHESKRMATPDRLVHGGSPPARPAQEGALFTRESHMLRIHFRTFESYPNRRLQKFPCLVLY